MSFRDGWNPGTVQLKELYEAKFNQYRSLKAELTKHEQTIDQGFVAIDEQVESLSICVATN